MEKRLSESLSSAGQSQEWPMTHGPLKLIAHARTVRATPTLCSMAQLVVLLGRWVTDDLSHTRFQRKVGIALELLGSEILAKQAEANGAENRGQESTRIRFKRNSSGKRSPRRKGEQQP
jgi:hypothetical protein